MSALLPAKADDKVALGLVGERLVLCRYVLEQCRVVKAHLVASLLEGYAEHLLVLHGSGGVLRVYLNDVVCALALNLQYFECLGGVARSYDTVADLALERR